MIENNFDILENLFRLTETKIQPKKLSANECQIKLEV